MLQTSNNFVLKGCVKNRCDHLGPKEQRQKPESYLKKQEKARSLLQVFHKQSLNYGYSSNVFILGKRLDGT
jgi:hypothetical protein